MAFDQDEILTKNQKAIEGASSPFNIVFISVRKAITTLCISIAIINFTLRREIMNYSYFDGGLLSYIGWTILELYSHS